MAAYYDMNINHRRGETENAPALTRTNVGGSGDYLLFYGWADEFPRVTNQNFEPYYWVKPLVIKCATPGCRNYIAHGTNVCYHHLETEFNIKRRALYDNDVTLRQNAKSRVVTNVALFTLIDRNPGDYIMTIYGERISKDEHIRRYMRIDKFGPMELPYLVQFHNSYYYVDFARISDDGEWTSFTDNQTEANMEMKYDSKPSRENGHLFHINCYATKHIPANQQLRLYVKDFQKYEDDRSDAIFNYKYFYRTPHLAVTKTGHPYGLASNHPTDAQIQQARNQFYSSMTDKYDDINNKQLPVEGMHALQQAPQNQNLRNGPNIRNPRLFSRSGRIMTSGGATTNDPRPSGPTSSGITTNEEMELYTTTTATQRAAMGIKSPRRDLLSRASVGGKSPRYPQLPRIGRVIVADDEEDNNVPVSSGITTNEPRAVGKSPRPAVLALTDNRPISSRTRQQKKDRQSK